MSKTEFRDALIHALINEINEEKAELIYGVGVTRDRAARLIKKNPILNGGSFEAVLEALKAILALEGTHGAEHVRTIARTYYNEALELLKNMLDNEE